MQDWQIQWLKVLFFISITLCEGILALDTGGLTTTSTSSKQPQKEVMKRILSMRTSGNSASAVLLRG
jgi:hypothetical protein